MSYKFDTIEGDPAVLRMRTRVNADPYTLTAEFTIHPYDPFDIEVPYLTLPVVSDGKDLTLNLTPEQVTSIGSSYFRVRAVGLAYDGYITDGKLQYSTLPPIAEVRNEDLILIDAFGREYNAGNITGPVGPTGAKGDKGDQGVQGVQGTVGPNGIQGIQGVQGTVGPAGLEWRGLWLSGTNYISDDAVYYNGSSWFASAAAPAGTVPSEDVDNPWQPLALRGAQGIQGPQGVQGIQGATGAQGATGSPGTNFVTSVNGNIGAVVLTAANVGAPTVANLTALDTRVGSVETTLAAATSASTPSTLIRRGTDGQFAVPTPSVGGHAANKDYVDAGDLVTRRPTRRFVNTSQILTLTDESQVIAVDTVNGPQTVTIPLDATVAFPVGGWVEIEKSGSSANSLTITPAGGVVLRNPVGAHVLYQINSRVRLTKIAADIWLMLDISGAMSTSLAAPNTVVRRDGGANATLNTLAIDQPPTQIYHATRKDYVDASSLFQQIKPVVGGAITTPAVTSTSTTPGIGLLVLGMMVLPPGTYDAVSCRVATPQAGATVKIVAYAVDAIAGGVGALLFETPAVAATAGGALSITLPSALVVGAGGMVIWVGLVNQGTLAAAFFGTSAAYGLPRLAGNAAAIDLGATTPPSAVQITGVTGAAPTSPSYTWSDVSATVHRFAFRRSA